MSKTSGDLQLYTRLLKYIIPYRLAFFISIIGFMLYAVMDVLAADVMQYLIDSMGGTVNTDKKQGLITGFMHRMDILKPNDSEQARIVIPIIIMSLAITRATGSFLGNYFIKYVGNHVVYQLRKELFEQLVFLPTAYIVARNSGSLVSRITFNVSQITSAVTTALTTIFREGLTVIFLSAYLLYINWKLTLTFVVVLPAIGLIVSWVSKRFRRISKRIQSSMGDVTHVISESVASTRDMKIYGAQDTEIDRFDEVNQFTLRQKMKMASTNAAFSPTIQVLLTVAICILVWLGLSEDIRSSMSAGLFVSFIIAAGALGKPLRQLTLVLGVVQKALAAVEDIFAQLDHEREEQLGTREIDNVKGEISFRDVCFTYPGQQESALNHVSFDIKPGEMVALVGPSGSGKSTLAGLLPRFYNVEQGDITIDDVSINELDLKNLRKHISLVSQNVVLMNDTIFNNIAYGELRGATLEQVKHACKVANADIFIEKMEKGYDTMIGDNGILLSGGQRQRLAIARAILKDAPILIMDEATSALDNESENMIQSALVNATRNKTTLVIAHRLSTIEQADKIIVLDHGQVVEQGTHQGLLEKNGRYAELHASGAVLADDTDETAEK